MKAKSKDQIAHAAGISTELLRRWMLTHRQQITALGVAPTRKLLPPRAVKFIAHELGIDEEDFD